jgi:hypothetical protein
VNQKRFLYIVVFIILASIIFALMYKNAGVKFTTSDNNISSECQELHSLDLESALTVDKALCEQCGGVWGIGPHPEGCNPPNMDADKSCTDSSQCVGLCFAEDDYENARKGKCSKIKFVFGCYSEIVKGRAQPISCWGD